MEPVTAVETGGTILSWISDYGMLRICSMGFIIMVAICVVLAWRYSGTLAVSADAQETLARTQAEDHKEIKEGIKNLWHEMEMLKTILGIKEGGP